MGEAGRSKTTGCSEAAGCRGQLGEAGKLDAQDCSCCYEKPSMA